MNTAELIENVKYFITQSVNRELSEGIQPVAEKKRMQRSN